MSLSFILTQYNNNYIRLTELASDKPSKSKSFSPGSSKNHSDFCNLSRTKNNIKKICLANHWDFFCTWTVSSKLGDRYSLDFCQTQMRKLMKAYKRKYKSFKFIYITESHKDGAFHFHGLVSGLGEDDLYVNSNNYLSSRMFDSLGFNSFSKIRDINKCGNYIMKYITKRCIKNEMGSIYFCSRGLSHGSSYFVEVPSTKEIFKNNYYDNGFIRCRDFILSSTNKDILLELMQIKEKKKK